MTFSSSSPKSGRRQRKNPVGSTPAVEAFPEREIAPAAAVVPQSLETTSPPGVGMAKYPVLFWIWVFLAAITVLWQPLELGFYMDDWGTAVAASHQGPPFSMARFNYILAIDPSRPSVAPLRYLCSSALSDSTIRWHVALVLAHIAIPLAIASLVSAILGLGPILFT